MSAPTPASILVVSARDTAWAALETALRPLEVRVLRARTPAEAEREAASAELLAGLVDGGDETLDAIAVAGALRCRARQQLPVILTGVSAFTFANPQRAIDAGVSEVIPEETPAELLRAKVALHARLHRQAAQLQEAESRLRTLGDSEAKYREIFETANEGIWILNTDLVIQTANRRMAEMLGYTVPQLVGRKKYDFVFPEDLAYIRGLFEERRSGRTQPAIEVRFRHRDGHAVWTLLSARPIYREGAFAGALDMFTDVTARRFAEDRFRVFFETSAAGHALIDPTTRRFVAVNRRFCEIAGRTADELRRLTFSDITHPDDLPADNSRFEQLYRGETTETTAEKRYVRPNGETVWVTLTTTMVRDANGQPEAQVSVVQDITARKLADAELVESRTRLRLAIEAAELGVFYYDTQTNTWSWNDRMRELAGCPPNEPASRVRFLAAVHPEDRARVEAEAGLRSTDSATAHDFDFEYRVVRPDGGIRWLRAKGAYEPGPAGQHRSLGTVRDITTAKEFEAELRRQIAERTRELEEKTRQLESFCYTVAHDLRAPLRAINGYADLAREELPPPAPVSALGHLDRIRESTKRLDALISDLLAYSRIDQLAVNREPVELQRVTAAVLHELESDIQRRRAEVVVEGELPSAIGEQSVVEQIVLNLVSNALKFTTPGVPPHVEIFATDGDGKVRLHVRDRGIGIPREYQQRIFRVFERLQTSRAYPGTGIGLAIVAKGMERLGGTYGVQSAPGEGSDFWIELPRAEPTS